MRCQAHQDLDRNSDEAERLVNEDGLPIDHPLVTQRTARVKSTLRMMAHRGHSINYDCPDEDGE